jgi:hypothetical protein
VGSRESKAKGSFGQKAFYFSRKLSFLKYGNTHLINELYYKIGR